MDIKNFNFDDRLEGSGIVFVGRYQPGECITNHEIKEGSSVTLRKGKVSIHTRIINIKGKGHFIGKVICFDDWDNFEFEGLKPDDLVSFSEDKIVACS